MSEVLNIDAEQEIATGYSEFPGAIACPQNTLLDALESLPEGIACFDQDQRLILANSAMVKFYPQTSDMFVNGTGFEELIRQGVEIGAYGPDAGDKNEWIDRILAYFEDPHKPIELRTRDDRYVRFSVRQSQNNGKLAILSDVSEARQMRNELQESKEFFETNLLELDASRQDLEFRASELVELAENQALLNQRLNYEIDVKNKFFSIIAHDLKSPFNSLLGMSEMMTIMAADVSKEKLTEMAFDINKAGKQVFELLQNLLEWSQLQMGGMKFQPEMIELGFIIDDIFKTVLPVAQQKNINLTNSVPVTMAFADRNMVQMVIRNLLVNALKFTTPGGEVTISAVSASDFVQITVNDTGVGMLPEKIEQIFALDQATSTTGTSGETGTGLGLPLCKDMIDRNNGEIRVESELGQGSSFHFTLPRLPAA